mmetsp:Transcript_16252/g.67246  ORF Transcript_16252/g.67246 Transcript_16252/m.67246 type:complete len:216 (+) Transcript_16252:1213-1860(+)
MIRDARMQELVAPDKEPITPFISRIRTMYEHMGISTILVIGGAGDYFDVADHVIMMDCYKPYDVTARAKEISKESPGNKIGRDGSDKALFDGLSLRYPKSQAVLNIQSQGKGRVSARTMERIEFGGIDIELDGVAQVIEKTQTRAIGDAMVYAANRYMNDNLTVKEVLDRVDLDIEDEGLDCISIMGPVGTLGRPRPLEIAAALNRLRGVTFKIR